jgi:hypothetical protein
MECILEKRAGKKTRRKQYFEYLVKWKNHPVEDASWEDRSSYSEAWAHRAAAHGQEPMKTFEPRSMMQEHLQLTQASQRGGKRRTAGQHQHIHFLNYFEKIVAPSFEGRHSKPKRTCIVM